jgi:epoxide hydrolase-like predicted phosphatase
MTSSVLGSFDSFCEREGLAPGAVLAQFRDPANRELLMRLETGTLAEAEFEPRFASILGVEAKGLIDRLFAASRPDEPMRRAVRTARDAGIRTGLISNSWGTRRYDRPLLDELFDGVVISGDVGIRKPAPEIYVLGAERIGIEPTRCVFVDDLPFNLDPASELGMATILHRDARQTIGELERVLETKLG